ncbi:hypothetical protein KAR91_68590 [Candidatus Pacearchaeota archaeon]|nr:hypothetical protein [Candidatus Pacearchaeota archaeon]
MNKIPSRFWIINEPDIRFRLNPFDKPMPVLWNKDGEFCVIPKAILQNAVDIKDMYDSSNGKITIPEVYIYWDQGITISNLAGRVLIGE